MTNSYGAFGWPLTRIELNLLTELLNGTLPAPLPQRVKTMLQGVRVKLGARNTAHIAWLAYQQGAVHLLTCVSVQPPARKFATAEDKRLAQLRR